MARMKTVLEVETCRPRILTKPANTKTTTHISNSEIRECRTAFQIIFASSVDIVRGIFSPDRLGRNCSAPLMTVAKLLEAAKVSTNCILVKYSCTKF